MKRGLLMDEVTSENRRTYDEIALQYADVRHDSLWQTDLLRTFASGLSRGNVVLDLACGPAIEAKHFDDLGFKSVGLDLSFAMLQTASRHGTNRLVQANSLALPFMERAFHGVWSSAALHHIPYESTDLALEEIRRVLVPGGRLALITAVGKEAQNREVVEYAEHRHRWFFNRDEASLVQRLTNVGFHVVDISIVPSRRTWAEILAVTQS